MRLVCLDLRDMMLKGPKIISGAATCQRFCLFYLAGEKTQYN